VKRWHKILTVGLAAAALAGCSSGETPEVPSGGAASSSQAPSGGSADGEEVAAGGTCVEGDATSDEVTVEFGEMAAASDEWSESLDRTWRHYFPVTVTNTSSVNCLYSLQLNAEIEGGETMNEDFSVALLAGQTYRGQVFDLEEGVEFNADTAEAAPAATVTPSVHRIGRSRMFADYYDANVEFVEIKGKGADATLVADLTVTQRDPESPDRLASAKDDNVIINGVDADGVVVVTARTVIDPLEDGATAQVEVPVAGGDASEWVRRQEPVSAIDDVVTWEIGLLQPVFTVDHELSF
jgi:hypothetical protein